MYKSLTFIILMLFNVAIFLSGCGEDDEANEFEKVIISETDGATMHLIPAGEFEMGDPFGEGNKDELPVHTVYLDAFYIDIYEGGNVWELCLDEFKDGFYPSSAKNNPVAGGTIISIQSDPASVDTARSLRGGAWPSIEGDLRVALRLCADPPNTSSNLGFRCVKAATP
jgi:formylglycine-generating enzyme required for sulfatase activity